MLSAGTMTSVNSLKLLASYGRCEDAGRARERVVQHMGSISFPLSLSTRLPARFPDHRIKRGERFVNGLQWVSCHRSSRIMKPRLVAVSSLLVPP